MVFDSKIWGPPMWFFLHTSAMCYPIRPSEVTKKKFYDFFQNLHLFIPVESMGSYFSKLLDEYPISPYLDNRESLIRWVWFIHNKINEKLEHACFYLPMQHINPCLVNTGLQKNVPVIPDSGHLDSVKIQKLLRN